MPTAFFNAKAHRTWLKVPGKSLAGECDVAPVRQMSSSSVPESSGGSLPYYLFIGGSLVGGGYYVYHKLRQDKEYLGDRYEFVYGKLRPEIEDDGKIIQVVGL
ncbi:hypothetical protein GDO78_011900 [Eleutherodactylus coqui]|uniref:Protein MGARP N-terminal domain-containing protein n=1 Tax=Eleutherodactylus coqui TaxID=57060 RepID=A0A8J6F1D8_ELECQ|nr:hypothetical protein GDO78_011900 [Eleutherodactylus coqui]